MSAAEVVLITGFPAPRARLVLFEVVAEPATRVALLVHPARRDEAEVALAGLALGLRERIELVLGDPAALDFGLSGRSYRELAESVRVVHAAYSVVDAEVGAELAESVNVGAARELAELSLAAKSLRAIVFYSSALVSGNRNGDVLESELEAGQAFRSAAERTLAIAERTLSRSAVPVVVLRAGHLLGDERSGELELSTGLYSLLLFVAAAPERVVLPLPHGTQARLPLTPLDHLVRVGVFASRQPSVSATLHVLSPAAPTLRELLLLVAQRTGTALDFGVSAGLLSQAFRGNSAARLLPRKLKGLFEVLAASARYDTTRADELTARGGPACPPLEAYLDRLVDALRQRLERGSLAAPKPEQAPFLIS